MCGIVGAFDTQEQRWPDRTLLARMNSAQIHRGPDEGSEICEPGIALGSRRLAIIDVSAGRQPATNESEDVLVVFNGEIYNFRELREELITEGHTFRTHCDTEVLAHGWEEWGTTCVKRFHGMFAFALFDRRKQVLFLGRDRLGKKPLHYTITEDGWLYFASELKSLLALPHLNRSLDPYAIEEYFAFGYVPDPRTIFSSISKLSPAHTLLVNRNNLPGSRPQLYWALEPGDPPHLSEPELADELRERLRQAVKARLISEVPLGAFLSGGIDSSSVVGLMAQMSGKPVRTCSISFGDPGHDESRFAALVSKQLHTDHATEEVGPDETILNSLAHVYDEPFADSSALPTFALCRLARRRVTVALSGDGGDEVFGGYRRYRWHLHEERIRALLPLGIRRPLIGTLGRIYPKANWAPRVLRAKATLEALAMDSVEGYCQSVSITTEPLRRVLFSPEFQRLLGGYRATEVLRHHADDAPWRDPLSLAQYLDLKTYLPGDILTKVDRASMAHSLEVRVPMLDHSLVEWVARLPSDLKWRNGRGKYILGQSMREILPRETIDRTKMGFAVPLSSWLRGPFRRQLNEAIAGERLRQSGWFDARTISRLAAEHQSGSSDHSAALWALLMFDRFLKRLAA